MDLVLSQPMGLAAHPRTRNRLFDVAADGGFFVIQA